jgi:RNA polymerase sigma-70 factor, ECF subfamily
MTPKVGFSDAELLEVMPALRKIAIGHTRNHDTANDLLHDTMLRMLDFKHHYQAGTALAAWGCVIMRNLWRGIARQNKRRISSDLGYAYLTLEAPDTVKALAAREELVRISKLSEKMSKEIWEALMLVSAGTEYSEVADIQGVVLGTAKSRVFRARELIRH